MKKLSLLAAGVALATSAMVSTTASAEVSYNIGFASEYVYRGISQSDSSASAGIDFEESGFYAGAWTADVGDGLEVDGYLGYGIETESGISASIGYTGYFYTGDFDTEYNEINLGLGYGLFSLEVSKGTHDVDGGSDEDYTYAALTVGSNGFYGTFGTFSQDWEGDFLQVGYDTTIADIDFGIAAIASRDYYVESFGGAASDDETLVFSISKSF